MHILAAMVRCKLVVLAVFSFFSGLFAQISNPEKGSRWIYDYVNLNSCGPIISTYSRDSLVAGKTAMVFDAKYYDVCQEPQEPLIDSFRYVANIIVIEDSLVWYWHNEMFDTLYDFAAKAGDEWKYRYSLNDTVNALVMGVGTDARLGYFLDIEFKHARSSYRDTIYERLLGGTNYIIPWDVMASYLDGHEGGQLRCFSNSTINYVAQWWETRNLPCDFLNKKIGITDVKNQQFSLYPNPGNGKLYLRPSENKKPKSITISDSRGLVVYQSDSTDLLIELEPQTYFVRIVRQDGRVEVHKVVVD